jgi:aminoglycoside phosphotransferase (APT) family kinase protein
VGKSVLADFPYKAANRKESGMPEPAELLERYAQITGFHPLKSRNGKDWESAIVFHYARGATISHGIQARSISGQNSSDFSHVYFSRTRKVLDAALKRVERFKSHEAKESKPRL